MSDKNSFFNLLRYENEVSCREDLRKFELPIGKISHDEIL